jgi:hypothetical protein
LLPIFESLGIRNYGMCKDIIACLSLTVSVAGTDYDAQ